MHGYLKIKKMRSSQEICKACSCDGLQMTTRWEKYPMASMSLIPDEIRELRRWAKEYHYEDRRGPQPGALARDLFRAAWEVLRECEFDVDRFGAKMAEIGGESAKRKKG